MSSSFVTALAVVTAVAAAARSTWSPCGLSMLSSITPMAERGRGHRFAVTASWLVLGSALGGATLGLATTVPAALAGAALASPASPLVIGALATAAALAAVALDAGLVPPALPHHRRQVNELWLNRYRPWVYGVGFGWQIGTGVATYIMTAAVYLLVVLAALTADVRAAVWVGVTYGVARGLAIVTVAPATTPGRLAAVHQRFERLREPVRHGVIVAEAAVAVLAATATGGALAGGAVLAAVVAGAAVLTRIGAGARTGEPAGAQVGHRWARM